MPPLSIALADAAGLAWAQQAVTQRAVQMANAADSRAKRLRRVARYAEIPYGLQVTLYGDKDEGRMD